MSASEIADRRVTAAPRTERYDIEIVVPVHNEDAELETNIRRLRRYLDEHLPFEALVTIADNGSTDATAAIAGDLSATLHAVRVVHLERKGRGRALRAVWSTSRSPVVAYMDVDLSTDLDGLLPLVAPLVSGHSDVAIGTRLAPDSRVVRGARRETISRIYNGLLRVCFRTRFTDAQCGFKAVRSDVARAILPSIDDDEWFFDTELLVLAERNGFRIHEVPVDWVDDDDSRVDVVHTALADLAGMWRLARRMAARTDPGVPVTGRTAPRDAAAAELVRFVAIGSGSTLAYFVLFLALRSPLGALSANTVALLLCSVGNRAAHRRARDAPARRAVVQHLLRTGAGFTVSFATTTAALLLAERLAGGSLPVQLAGLVAATAAATVVRFAMLRWDRP